MAFKKCRYCGGTRIKFRIFANEYFLLHYCECQRCGNVTENFADRESAFKAWNKENGV